MKEEYDFTGKKGVRGKYAKAYNAGHSVRIYDGDKIVSDNYFASIEPRCSGSFSRRNVYK